MKSEKKKIITITGGPGSGKSTTAKIIAARLQLDHFSAGDLFRSVSQERGEDVTTTNQNAEKEAGIPEIDQLVDQKLRDLSTSDKLIIDSRTAWHWIPDSYKVYMNLDLDTAARRILSGITHERAIAENIHEDPIIYAKDLEERLASETRRYKKLYDINPHDFSNYDLVIDTKVNDIDSVVNLILQGYSSWVSN